LSVNSVVIIDRRSTMPVNSWMEEQLGIKLILNEKTKDGYI